MTNVTIYADRKDVTKATDGGEKEAPETQALSTYIYILDARREGLKALSSRATLRRFDASTLRCFANGAAEDVSTLRRFAKGGG